VGRRRRPKWFYFTSNHGIKRKSGLHRIPSPMGLTNLTNKPIHCGYNITINIITTGTKLETVMETSIESFDDLVVVWQVIWRYKHHWQAFTHCTSRPATPMNIVLNATDYTQITCLTTALEPMTHESQVQRPTNSITASPQNININSAWNVIIHWFIPHGRH